jgi:phenylalanyl-tRNA synthetase beta chain
MFEMGAVFRRRPGGAESAEMPGIDRRPSEAELADIDAALPVQPRHFAALLCGELEPRGWWGAARPATWADAVELARIVARAARHELVVRPAQTPPWHPGRCAELVIGEAVVGHAGELHPGAIARLGLPERTCAVEIDLDSVPVPAPVVAPSISTYPPVLLDVALVVDRDVAAAVVERTLHAAAGPLLESIRLFDVYVDEERLGPDARSLAFALRFRATGRTLTVEEATTARDAAIAAAVEAHGARPRT